MGQQLNFLVLYFVLSFDFAIRWLLVTEIFLFARSYELQYLERNPPQYYLVFIRVLSLSLCRIGIWRCCFLRREESQPSRSNNKLNPHMASDRNLTLSTLEGGERSHHCAIPAPP